MAKGEYIRLGCSVASCDGQHKAKGFCLKHYRQYRRGGIKAEITACVHCGAKFQPFNVQSMYCSKACKIDAWKVRTLGTRPAVKRSKIAATKKRNALEREICRRVKAEVDALHRIARHVERPRVFIFNCIHCGTPMIVRRNAGLHKQCCDDCIRVQMKIGRRIAKGIRRAKTRGVRADSIDPIKVFERDKWKCHMCGAKTLRSLRGTYEDRSPELDHIVPLARGGTHTWGNVACSCRKCNGTKGATAYGQLGLGIAA